MIALHSTLADYHRAAQIAAIASELHSIRRKLEGFRGTPWFGDARNRKRWTAALQRVEQLEAAVMRLAQADRPRWN